MALQKNMTSKFGGNVTYWKVIRADLYAKGPVFVTVHGFPDKATRDAKKEPMEIKEFAVQNADLVPTELIAWCYGKLKAEEFFAGSLDV